MCRTSRRAVTGRGADQRAHAAEPPDQLIFPLVAEPGRRRRRIRAAVAAATVPALAVLLVTAAMQLRDAPTAGDRPSPVTTAGDADSGLVGGPASVFELEPGSCLADLGPRSSVSEVSVVPCDLDHVARVIATARMPEGAWPGVRAVEEFAADRCVPAIHEAGIEDGDGDLQWSYFGPSESSWVTRTDRTVSCLVVTDGWT